MAVSRRPFLVLLSVLSFTLHAQEIREDVLITFPAKTATPSEGQRILTLRMPPAWVMSDTAAVNMLKNLSASKEPYYLLDPADGSRWIALVWKKEVAPMVFQYVVSENFPDGSVKRYDVLNDRGRKNGTHIEFWKPGTVKLVGSYMNGKPDGEWQHYDSTGKMIQAERYSVGEKEKDRIIKHPHVTWYSAVVARTPVLPAIIIPNSVEKHPDPLWKIDEKHYGQIWALSLGAGFITSEGLGLIDYPSMLGLPEESHFTAHLAVSWWDPKRWNGEIEVRQWLFTSAKGVYQNTNVKVSCKTRYYTFSGGYGFVRMPRAAIGGMLGITLAAADLRSKDLDASKGQGDSYFELSSLAQGPMITPSLYYDLRFPFRGKISTGILFKTGYHISLSEARWHLLGDAIAGHPEKVNLGGWYASLAFKIARLRRV